MDDTRPLFDAVYVVSVQAGRGGGEGGREGHEQVFPSSSVEAYELASARCAPRVIWR